ncbi:MAG TPA: EAL domain-containing protein, partial [Hydrogenobaculum sp.]|nr:EAL domain-containing protein [Hydrogenobaculum sp.]
MQNNVLDKILITIVKETNPWIVIADENINMIYISDSASKISGYSEEDLIGKNPNIFRAYVRENNFYKELWDTITEGKVFEHVFVNKTKDGKLFYIEGKIIPIEIDGTKYFVSAGRDIIPEMKILKELEDIKNKDIVTGFYNYETFKNMFAEGVHNIDYGIVIAFKIENLSIVRHLNDIPNYHKILKHISEKLRYAIGDLDISIGRLSEDEFVTFMKNTTEKDALNSIKDIAKGLMDLELDPQKYHGVGNISIKIGVSLYGKDGTDIETLCRKANVACSYDSNDCIVSFFNEAMEHSLRQLETADSLILEAFEKNQFCFYLQPYYRCTRVPHIKGFESLIRIVKDGKIYSPCHFIDYLEQSKHLRRFEEWSLDEISHIIRAIKKNISLNLSARSFSDEIFISMLLEKAQELYPFLTVEITERTAMGNIDK